MSRIQGLGFKVQVPDSRGFRVQVLGLGFGVWGWGLGFGVRNSGLGLGGLGSGVWGLMLGV